MNRAVPDVEVGLEVRGVPRAERAVDAVGGDDEVGVGQPEPRQVGVVADRRSGSAASTPSSAQRSCRMSSSFLRAMPAKPWPLEVMTRPRTWTSMSSQWAKLAVIASNVGGVGGAEVLERLVGEHHAPAEGVVAAVALEHRDVGVGPGLLEQEREVEPGRPAADDRDLHDWPSLRHVPPAAKPRRGATVTAARTWNLGWRHSPWRSTCSRRSTASQTSTNRV